MYLVEFFKTFIIKIFSQTNQKNIILDKIKIW